MNKLHWFLLGSILSVSAVFGEAILAGVTDRMDKPKVYEVRTCEDIDNMRNDLDGIYIQMNDIDCKGFISK
jgi:hypothetical protein